MPITFSGFEVGVQIKTGEVFNEIDTLSPLYLGYQHWSARLPGYKGDVIDNASYDQTAVLYAVMGGIDKYWSRVDGGYCEAIEPFLPEAYRGSGKNVDDHRIDYAKHFLELNL